MIQQKLDRVRAYIANKDFDNARAILETIDHPKRDEWLLRVDRIQRQHAVEQLPKPMHPGLLKWLTFLLTPILSTLLLAYNWRRFEKKSWMWWTLLSMILLPPAGFALLIGLTALHFFLSFNVAIFTKAIVGGIFFLLVLSGAFPFMIAGQQEKAYKLMKQKNIHAAYDYPYSWLKAIAIWVLVVGVITAGATLVGTSESDIYDDGWIRLELPFEWEESDDPYYTCKDIGDECHLILETTLSELNIVFKDGGWVDGYENNQAMADAQWDWLPETDFDRVWRDSFIINGHKAFAVAYDDDDSSWHYVELYIMEGDDILFITVEGMTQEMIENSWNDILAMLGTMEWTP